MKKNTTFPVEIKIGDNAFQLNVREHPSTDGRYTVQYINEDQPLTFQLVRTPIGHWAAGNAQIPDWLHNHANEIGKIITSQSSHDDYQRNNSIRATDK